MCIILKYLNVLKSTRLFKIFLLFLKSGFKSLRNPSETLNMGSTGGDTKSSQLQPQVSTNYLIWIVLS